MKKLMLAALGVVLIAGAQAVELARYVDNRAIAFVHVPDVPKLIEQSDKSPFSRTLKDEKVQKFFAPALAKFDIDSWDEKQRASTGLSFKELLALPRGEALIAVVDGTPEPVALLLVDIGEGNQKKVLDLVKHLFEERNEGERKVSIAEESIAGATIHEATITEPEPRPKKQGGGDDEPADGPAKTVTHTVQWFAREGVFVAGVGKPEVSALAVAIGAGGAKESLSQADAYLRHLDRVKGKGFGLTVDFNNLGPAILKHLATPEASKNPLTDPQAIMRTLGIGDLDTLFVDVRLEDDAMHSEAGLRYRDFRGLVSLAALGEGPAPQPDFVPQAWLAVSSMRLKLSDVFGAVEGLFQAHHPASAALWAGNIAAANAKIGFDLKRDLFGSLGDECVIASVVKPGVSSEKLTAFDLDNFYAFSVTNPKALAGVLASLVKQIDPQNKGVVASKDFSGTVIQAIPLAPDPVQGQRFVNFCLWKNWFFVTIGTPAPIEAAILCSSRQEANFWKRDDVKQALAETPSDAGGFAFQDNRVTMSMLVVTFARLAELAARDSATQAPLVDPSAKPDAGDLAKYWLPSFGYYRRDANSIQLISKLPYVQ